VVGVALLVSAGLVTAHGTTPAGALTSRPSGPGVATPGGPTTTSTTVVSPTTTVVTTTGPTSVTTAPTTVTSAPTSVTSTTVTSVIPTTTVPSKPTSTSTTTTAPRATTTTTVPVPHPTAPVAPPPGAPSVPTFDTNCSAPLQTYLDALPAGAVFRSSATACYEVTNGIVLNKPISIIGGTFYDPSTARPPVGGLKPIILIQDTSNVTISGVSVLGANATGDFHDLLVGEAGVKLESARNVTLTGVTAKNTFGDGLELVADLSHRISTPVSGLTVDGYTTVDAGRQGVTIAEVSGATLNHVNVVNPADSGFDFESDIPGLGAGNVTITNCTDDHGFNFVETLTGPITISGCTGFHHLHLSNTKSPGHVYVVGGLMICKRTAVEPCITQTGGWLTFTGVTVQRLGEAKTITGPMWLVTSGGQLSFVESQLQVGFGSVATSGTVKIIR
jgi:hypothetical protein